MKSLIKYERCFIFIYIVFVILTLCVGCSKKPPQSQPAVIDKPLADFQLKLLDTAFDTASLIPVYPSIKDRCQAQEQVVDACLELNQPVRAIRYADQIQNWRMGYCYAKTAVYLAENGYGQDVVQKGLDVAEEVAALDHGQDWRNNRIKTKISRAYILLGRPEKAEAIMEQMVGANASKNANTQNTSVKKISFEAQVQALDSAINLMDFDLTIGALNSYAQLYNQHYDEADKRTLIKKKIAAVWEKQKLPVNLRIELWMKMAEYALKYSDTATALELVNETQTLFDAFQWSPEHYIPVSANIAKLRFRVGDTEKANKLIDSVWEKYQTEKEALISILRTETMCPIAETFEFMGRHDMAVKVYKKALEEAMVNRNLKPRAEDISLICCSMAVHAVHPDESWWTRISEIQTELKQQYKLRTQ